MVRAVRSFEMMIVACALVVMVLGGCGRDPLSIDGDAELSGAFTDSGVLLDTGSLPGADLGADDPTLIRLPSEPPEDLLQQLLDIYNDDASDAATRLAAYAALFPPDDHPRLPPLTFYFQPSDVKEGAPISWGLDSELNAHGNMFAAQEAGDIFDLSLSMTIEQPQPVRLEPELGYRVLIDAVDIELTLFFSPQDGLQVSEAFATFDLSTADDRWYINDWSEVEPLGVAVDPTSWGDIKSAYRD